jgi:hypothetical protein
VAIGDPCGRESCTELRITEALMACGCRQVGGSRDKGQAVPRELRHGVAGVSGCGETRMNPLKKALIGSAGMVGLSVVVL